MSKYETQSSAWGLVRGNDALKPFVIYNHPLKRHFFLNAYQPLANIRQASNECELVAFFLQQTNSKGQIYLLNCTLHLLKLSARLMNYIVSESDSFHSILLIMNPQLDCE